MLSSSEQAAAGVSRLFDILKFLKQVERAPNFTTMLGLDFYHVIPSLVGWDEIANTLTVELPNPHYASTASNNTSTTTTPHNRRFPPSLSTQLALVDETTTWALMLADIKRNRPGVSVSLKAQRAGPLYLLQSCPTLKIVNQVTKVGHTLGFCQAQVLDADSGTVLCYASHIKYLPMGFLTDRILLSGKGGGWEMAKLYSQYSPPKPKVSLSLNDSLDSFHFHPPGHNDTSSSSSSSSPDDTETLSFATFQSKPVHTNGVGTLHGGMQAILLEQAVLEQLQLEEEENGSSRAPQIVDSMSIDYLSVAKSKTLYIPIEPLFIRKGRDARLFDAKVMSNSLICSQGQLRVVNDPSS